MNIRFDHLSLSAKNPERIRDFLIDLLGFKLGIRPNLSFDGYFLFSGKQDLIHIFARSSNLDERQSISGSQEAQNKILCTTLVFFSDDYNQVMQRIGKLNLQYSVNTTPDSNVKQIFVRAPENLIIEIQAIPPSE